MGCTLCTQDRLRSSRSHPRMGQAATCGQGHPPTLLTHASPGAGVCRPWRVCPGLGGYSGPGLGIGVTQVWPQTCPLLPVSKAWPRASHRDSKFSVVTSQGRGWPCLRVCAEEDMPAARLLGHISVLISPFLVSVPGAIVSTLIAVNQESLPARDQYGRSFP